MAGEKTYSAKQVATRIGTEARVLRKFFRDPNSGYDPVGQGGRYDFPETEIAIIKVKFDQWSKGKTKRNRLTNAEKAAAKTSTIPKQRTEPAKKAAAPRRGRNEKPPSPLEGDDLMARCRSSIGDRARAKGVTTDRTGRWTPVPEKLITKEEARRTIPGFAKSVDSAKALFNELLEEVLEEREPTPDELDAALDELTDEDLLEEEE